MKITLRFPALRFSILICAAQLLSTTCSNAQSGNWIVSWGASHQIPEPQNALPADDLKDATVRQIVHLSIGGSTLRVHISNTFGTEALHSTSVHIAKPVSLMTSAIDAVSDKALTFAGKSDVLVQAGDAAAVVALGDSITDGHGATTNSNDCWTDVLATRLQANKKTQNIGITNQGIGGNHLLSDGLGPNMLARL